MVEENKDPFAHIPDGRLRFRTDVNPVPVDRPRTLKVLALTERAVLVLMAVVTAVGVWTAAAGLAHDTAETEGLLLAADATWAIALIVCGSVFIWWHATVDSVARAFRDELKVPRDRVTVGWVIPIWTWFIPIQSIFELARAHGARRARRVAGIWWALWLCVPATGLVWISMAANNASEGALDAVHTVQSLVPIPAGLAAAVVVRDLSAAVRARLGTVGRTA